MITRKKVKPVRPKLSVFTDRATMRRLHQEKVETDLTLEELVNERLRLSYYHAPAPLKVDEPVAG